MELCVAEETLKRVRKLFFKTNDLLGQFLSKDSIISKKKKGANPFQYGFDCCCCFLLYFKKPNFFCSLYWIPTHYIA